MNTISRRTPTAESDALGQTPNHEFSTLASCAAAADTQMSATALAANYVAPLGYSEVPDDDAPGSESEYNELSTPDNGGPETAHSLRRLVVSAAASILAVTAIALVISLAIGIRTTGDRLPTLLSARRTVNRRAPWFQSFNSCAQIGRAAPSFNSPARWCGNHHRRRQRRPHRRL